MLRWWLLQVVAIFCRQLTPNTDTSNKKPLHSSIDRIWLLLLLSLAKILNYRCHIPLLLLDTLSCPMEIISERNNNLGLFILSTIRYCMTSDVFLEKWLSTATLPTSAPFTSFSQSVSRSILHSYA